MMIKLLCMSILFLSFSCYSFEHKFLGCNWSIDESYSLLVETENTLIFSRYRDSRVQSISFNKGKEYVSPFDENVVVKNYREDDYGELRIVFYDFVDPDGIIDKSKNIELALQDKYISFSGFEIADLENLSQGCFTFSLAHCDADCTWVRPSN